MTEKPTKADLELYHRVAIEPKGTFKKFNADNVGTDKNIAQHLQNIDERKGKIDFASNTECYIEVISIRIQIIDFWLRIYFTNFRIMKT